MAKIDKANVVKATKLVDSIAAVSQRLNYAKKIMVNMIAEKDYTIDEMVWWLGSYEKLLGAIETVDELKAEIAEERDNAG